MSTGSSDQLGHELDEARAARHLGNQRQRAAAHAHLLVEALENRVAAGLDQSLVRRLQLRQRQQPERLQIGVGRLDKRP